MAFNPNMRRAIFAAAFGSGFQHGFHSGVLNILSESYVEWLTDVRLIRRPSRKPGKMEVTALWATSVALYYVGGIAGACLIRYFADNCGRKSSLLWSNIIMILAVMALMGAFSIDSYELFMMGRLLAGIGAGLNSGLCPIYLTEIAPVESRGRAGSYYHACYVLGVLSSFIAGRSLHKKEKMHYCFILPLIAIAMQFLTLPGCPESPKYILSTEYDLAQARAALTWFRMSRSIDEEFKALVEELDLLDRMPECTLKTMCDNRKLRISLFVALVLHVGQQFSGVNAMINYSHNIFHVIKLEREEKDVGMIMFYSSMVTFIIGLIYMDRIERKKFLFWSFIVLALDTILVAYFLVLSTKPNSPPLYKFLCVASMVPLLMIFVPGIGCIPWYVTSEMFPDTYKTLAVSISVTANWTCNAILEETFPIVGLTAGYYHVSLFILTDIISAVIIRLLLIPTTRKTPKEIIEYYNL